MKFEHSLPIKKPTGDTASENIAALFQPDTLVSAQFFGDRRGKTLLMPEKGLMLAVLEDAITCFQENHEGRCKKSQKLFAEAEEWIFSLSDWVFGFENICSALEVEPEYIRAGLRRWRDN